MNRLIRLEHVHSRDLGRAVRDSICRVWTALLMVALLCDVRANPQGMTVANGSVSAAATGQQLDITASHNAVILWQNFNIGIGEATTFHQPSPTSIVWNRINDPNPSQIWGHLNADGIVVLMNQSGFYFGPNSVVNVAGLVVTTSMPPPAFGYSGLWQFNGPPPLASIVNYGQIHVSRGGSAFLIAERIENHGEITAPEGNIGLAIDSTGKIIGVEWKKGAGNSRWDESVRRAVARTKSMNRPPPKDFPEKFVVRFDVGPVTEPILQ